MRHVFKATKIGWDKEQEESGSTLTSTPRKRQKPSSNHIREPHNAATHILVTNTMESNITM